MTETETSLVIEWYEELEERLREFLRFVPPTPPKNLLVSSHVLGGLVTEACGVLDSLFRQLAPVKSRRAKKKLDIRNYKTFFGPRLATTESLLLVSPVSRKQPFKEWQSSQPKSPPWWVAHNNLKHNRIENIHEATLSNALDSMCALQQAIALLPEMAAATLRHGWINASGWNPEILLEQIETRDENAFPQLIIETALFAVTPSKSGFPKDLSTLGPGHFHASQRFRQFVGTW